MVCGRGGAVLRWLFRRQARSDHRDAEVLSSHDLPPRSLLCYSVWCAQQSSTGRPENTIVELPSGSCSRLVSTIAHCTLHVL